MTIHLTQSNIPKIAIIEFEKGKIIVGINLEKIKEVMKGRVAVIIICGALLLVSLFGVGKGVSGSTNLLPEPVKVEVKGSNLEYEQVLTKIITHGKNANYYSNQVQHIESIDDAYENVVALKASIGHLLKTVGLEDAKVYVKTCEVISGNKILYGVELISVFTDSNTKQSEFSEIVTQVLKDNIAGRFDVKVYGKLNIGK